MGKDFITTIILAGKASPSLKKAFEQQNKMAETSQQKMKRYSSIIQSGTLAAGAAMLAGAAYATDAAMKYETSLAKVSTVADTSQKSMAQISNEVVALSNKTGIAVGELNAGLYEAISAGINTADSVKFMAVAVKAAKGGFTDTQTAVDGLSSVMNAYGLQTKDANKLANQFLITQNLGKTTFGDLAQSIGKLAPITKAANVGTNEMLSSLAALTANGIQTSEAVSGMKAAISNVIKPTAEAQIMASKLGLEFNANALATKGLSGFLKDVKAKTGGNVEIMSQLFGSVEGLNSVLTLTSDNGMALMGKSMKEMQTNSKALQKAYDAMRNTPEERMKRLQNRMQNVALVIGEGLLPVVEKGLVIADRIDWNKVESGIKFVGGAIVVTTTYLLAYNAAVRAGMIITALSKAWEAAGVALALLREGETVATVAQLLLNGAMIVNPIGIVIAAIAALAAGFIYLWHTNKKFRDFFLKMWDSIKNVAGKIADWFSGIFGGGDVTRTVTLGAKTADAQKAGAKAPLKKHGTGGTFTTPHLAVVGDRPETIVPHGNTPRNRALLSQAAAGVRGSAGGTVVNLNFAPIINGAENVRQQLLDAADDLEIRVKDIFGRESRLSYDI